MGVTVREKTLQLTPPGPTVASGELSPLPADRTDPQHCF